MKKGLSWMIACLILFVPLFFLLFHEKKYEWDVILKYRTFFLKGWIMTLLLSSASLVVSTLIASLCTFAKLCKFSLLRQMATLYIEIVRGTPLLVQLLFFFYVVAHSSGIESRTLCGILILSIYSSAYLAEIFRAGITNISSSQIHSASSLGFSKMQIYCHIIIPQAFRKTLPPLAGQFASLIKDSSLLSILGINELTYTAEQVNCASYCTLETFFPIAIGYLLLTLPLSLWSKYLERKYLYET